MKAAVDEARVQHLQGDSHPVDVVRRNDHPGAGFAHELRGRAVRGNHGENRPPCSQILVHLARHDALSKSVGIGDEQEKRLGVTLEPKGFRARRIRDEL